MADEVKDVVVTDDDLKRAGLPSTMEMSPGLAIFFNEAMYQKCKQIASIMSGAEGMVGKHLIGKQQACFAVVSRSIVWKLDPFSVAMATYQTPGGSVGYEGKLIQAILENSGQLIGGVNYELKGDWDKVKNKFKLETSSRNTDKKFPVPTWTAEDAKGLFVTVSALVKGETEPRTLDFDLIEAFPLNSPLWATAPHRQIKYTAVRAFANQVVPSLLMGVPFDVDPTGFYGEPMTDVTPARPTRAEFKEGETLNPPAPKGKTAFDRTKDVQDVETETGAEKGKPEPSQSTETPAESIETKPAATSEPVVAQAEMHPAEEAKEDEDEKPGGEPSKMFAVAAKMVTGLIGNLKEVAADDLAGARKRGRDAIDSIEGLEEEERDVLRGRFVQAAMEEEKARGGKKKPKK